jgi:CO/xanthine dehydrogenase FAD-binding subunit
MDLNTVTEIRRPRQRTDLPPWQVGDAWLAGGTWLYSEPQPSLCRLIDIAEFAWPSLHLSEQGLEIAATCRITELDAMALPPTLKAAPLFNQSCRSFLASFKVWNTATVGGNICMALPAGPMISLTTALDGICTIWSPDGSERRLAVADFVLGPQRNALEPGELLRLITLPVAALSRRGALRQISLSPLGRSAGLLIGTLAADGAFTLTVTASTPRPVRLSFSALPSTAALRQSLETKIPASCYYDDIHGTPAWRRQVTLQFAEEILRELAGEEAA